MNQTAAPMISATTPPPPTTTGSGKRWERTAISTVPGEALNTTGGLGSVGSLASSSEVSWRGAEGRPWEGVAFGADGRAAGGLLRGGRFGLALGGLGRD